MIFKVDVHGIEKITENELSANVVDIVDVSWGVPLNDVDVRGRLTLVGLYYGLKVE